LTLPNALAGLIVVALNAYVLLGGADFGGGVWDLLATGPRTRLAADPHRGGDRADLRKRIMFG